MSGLYIPDGMRTLEVLAVVAEHDKWCAKRQQARHQARERGKLALGIVREDMGPGYRPRFYTTDGREVCATWEEIESAGDWEDVYTSHIVHAFEQYKALLNH